MNLVEAWNSRLWSSLLAMGGLRMEAMSFERSPQPCSVLWSVLRAAPL